MLSYKSDYAKSGRSKCNTCSKCIEKDTLRLGVIIQSSTFDGKYPTWYHPTCFFTTQSPKDVADFENFQLLQLPDQNWIKENIDKKMVIKSNDDGEQSSVFNFNVELNKLLTERSMSSDIDLVEETRKIQNQKIYNFRDCLKDHGFKRLDLKNFLFENEQYIPEGIPSMHLMIAEILTCGAMEKCQECNYGTFYFDGKNSYECQEYTMWGKCTNTMITPVRKHWKIPKNCSNLFINYLNSIIEHRLEDRIFLNCSISEVIKEIDMNLKKKPHNIKKSLKAGLEIDPKSELDKTTHIYEKNGYKYNSSLIKADIQNGKNCYYIIQLLEDDEKSIYWVFRSWGRTGTDIGGTKKKLFDSSSEAIREFEKLYLEKTGNKWTDPLIYKKSGKYLPVEIDNETEKNVEKVFEHSELELPVQKFLELITNIDFMENIMVEFDIDIEKMPLGKITSNQLKLANRILDDISQLIINGGTEAHKLIKASNQFYFAIPHNVGTNNLPILATKEQVLQKRVMLNELKDIQINYDIINIEQLNKKNPIDVFYGKLKTEIKTISSDSDQFQLIKKYIENTHAKFHNFKIQIVNIFEIKRNDEDLRYEPFKNYENRKLIWHGSRLTNFSGILTNGLLIPKTFTNGEMFGNGVYFSDVVSKSAQYCKARKSNGIGAMLLCEVALGQIKEFKRRPTLTPQSITKLMKKKNKSCKGLGKEIPNPEERVIQNGVEIPLGKLMHDIDSQTADLYYNEYIVYNVEQINCKFLVLLDFN